MAKFLKQSTAHTFRLGRFVSSTDAVTPQTGLTIAATSVLLSKNGGAYAAKNEATAPTGTGTAQGYYTIVLDATDTNTLGALRVEVYVAGALPVWEHFTVVDAVVFDSLFATNGTDYLQVDVKQINSNTNAAVRNALSSGVIIPGTVTSSGHTPTTTAFKASDITEATDDHFIGRSVIFTSGALLGQATAVTDYTGSTSVYTVTAMTEAPGNGDTFILV